MDLCVLEENTRTRSLCFLVASSVLWAVAISSESETDFLAAGNISTDHRTTMLTQHLEMHCRIRGNVGLLLKALGDVPSMTGDQVRHLRSEMPLAGRRQVEENKENLSSDDDSLESSIL